MKKQKVTTNYLYNVAYQILTFITPIITAPYLARTLGADNIGIYNYTSSIVYWFTLFGMMGISIYGNKECAKVADNREELSKKFSEIFCLQLITVITSLIVFYIIFGIGNFEYKKIFLIQGLTIFAFVFDISWLFVGLENFKKTTIRNFITKIILVIGIFVIVKNQNSLLPYTTFICIMSVIGQLALWLGLNKVIDFKIPKLKNVLSHFKENIILFIPQIATSIYGVFDQTMIGLLYDDVSEVGFYSQAHKLVNMLLFLVTTIGTVMLPRAVKMRSDGNEEKLKEITNFTYKIAMFLSIPIAIGFGSIAPFFIPWFLTEEFIKVGYIIPTLAPIIFFISLTNIMGYQFLIVYDETKKFTLSVVLGCVCNLILNYLLIGKYGAYGASIASVITEFIVFTIQYIFVRKAFDFSGTIKKFIKYLISAIIMGAAIIYIGFTMGPSITTNIIQFIVGFSIYMILIFMTHDDIQKFLIDKGLQILKIKK